MHGARFLAVPERCAEFAGDMLAWHMGVRVKR